MLPVAVKKCDGDDDDDQRAGSRKKNEIIIIPRRIRTRREVCGEDFEAHGAELRRSREDE